MHWPSSFPKYSGHLPLPNFNFKGSEHAFEPLKNLGIHVTVLTEFLKELCFWPMASGIGSVGAGCIWSETKGCGGGVLRSQSFGLNDVGFNCKTKAILRDMPTEIEYYYV